ncbi:MAG: hypothetical protein PHF56_01265 [Desulfuromonadaceae bacterium]|nr:hypothetical protein [Desulfuromonadaceae bacterium]
MKKLLRFASGFICLSISVSAFGAEKQKPYPHYWMSVATSSQNVPGMPAGMDGIASLFGGKKLFGPQRELRLQLESPQIATDTPKAAHEIPPEQKMGTALPLVTPVRERSEYVPPERGERPEQYEKPKARMLIYWGCGETIGKGQPKIIDTASMSLTDFGKAFTGRTPTRSTPPSPRSGWTYGEWPTNDERTEIPAESSLVGRHLIKGNYTPDISFTLDKQRDFMAPVEFSPLQKTTTGALKTEWKSIPTAIGYFATAIGHNQDTGETIFWSASDVPELGFSLQDYLTPSDVSRFIKEKVLLGPSKTSCTVPPVFRDGQPGMLQFIAYGEELNLAHPPKPKDPKKRWDIEWSAKVRLKSTAMMPLMAQEEGGVARTDPPARKTKTSGDTEKEQPDAPGSGTGAPVKEIGNRLRGILGF